MPSIHESIRQGRLGTDESFLRSQVNALDESGYSPLMVAVLTDADIPLIRTLLAYGADVNQTTADGYTALHISALVYSGPEGVEKLATIIGAGANLECKLRGQVPFEHYAGWTPLILGAAEGDVTIVKQFLEGGADPNSIDLEGRTPLMQSVRQSRQPAEKVRVLLSHGAKSNLRSFDDRTALDYAKEYYSHLVTLRDPSTFMDVAESVGAEGDSLLTLNSHAVSDHIVHLIDTEWPALLCMLKGESQ